MKPSVLLFLPLVLAVGPALQAQDYPPPTAATAPALNTDQLDELLGPVALYPDPLLSVVLPAATVPSDIVLAARYLNGGGDPNQVDGQPWDDSVRALAHYPEVVKWMDENLAWTRQVGEAFVEQPTEVMNSVQRLRAQAQAVGSLVTTAQQQVVVEDNEIEILPAQPDVIYVPRYDPEVVYVERPAYYTEPYISFGVGFAVGSWLFYDLDWGRHSLWVGSRRDWRRPAFSGSRPPSNFHAWRPRPNQHPMPSRNRWNGPNFVPAQPRPIVGAPQRPANWPSRRNEGFRRDQRSGPDNRAAAPTSRPENRSFTPRAENRSFTPRPDNRNFQRPEVNRQPQPQQPPAPVAPAPRTFAPQQQGRPAVSPGVAIADLPPTGPIPERQGDRPQRTFAPSNRPVPPRAEPSRPQGPPAAVPQPNRPPQAQGPRQNPAHPQGRPPNVHPQQPAHQPPPPKPQDRRDDDHRRDGDDKSKDR